MFQRGAKSLRICRLTDKSRIKILVLEIFFPFCVVYEKDRKTLKEKENVLSMHLIRPIECMYVCWVESIDKPPLVIRLTWREERKKERGY